MPGYAILGEGEVTKQYAIDTLASLRAKTQAKDAEDTEFFMILPYILQSDGKQEFLGDAMADILEWVEDEQIWARLFAAKAEDEDEQPQVEEFKVVGKRSGTVYQAVVKDVINEGGELLVIPWTMDWDEVDSRDEELVQAIIAANQNGVVVRQLNNGMLELDLTDESEKGDEDDDSPSEQDVRDMAEEADKGDVDAAAKLEELGKEYGFDTEVAPYDKMSWSEFAEAVLAKFAEDQNASVDTSSVPPENQPQEYDRAELEGKPIRALRSLAIAEGWGKSGQSFPHWFLVKHLADGTVPSKVQLEGKTKVPDEDPGEGATERPARGRSKGAVKGPEDQLGATNRAGLINVANHLAAAADALRAYAGDQ